MLTNERNLLQTLLDNLPDHIYIKDRQSRMVRNNQAQLKFLGKASQSEMSGKTDFELFPGEFAAKAYEDEQRLMAGGPPVVDKVWQVPDAAGTNHWLSETKLPLYNDRNEIVGMVGISHDFTKRKTYEDNLMYERTLLRSLLDSIPDSIYYKDTESRFIRVNKAWATRRNIADPSHVVGKTDFDFFEAEIAQERFEEEQEIVRSGRPLIGKIERISMPNGTQYWTSVTKVPIRDEQGLIIGTCGISRDITGVIQAENRLAHERNLLRTLIDNIPDYIYIKDAKGLYLINNEAHIRLLQHKSQEELLGKTDFDFMPRETAEMYQREEKEIFRTGIPVVNREEPSTDSMGIKHWLLVTKAPYYDTEGKIAGVIGISRDITKRRNFEEMLMYERQLLHTLLDNVPDSIYYKDARSRFIRVNAAWASRRHLADPEDVIGKTDFDFFPTDLAQLYYDDEQDILRTGKPLINKVEKIELPGMPTRWISITKVPITDLNKVVIGTCGISRDITQMVKAEEELSHERDLLHILMDNSEDLIYFKDAKSRITRANRAYARRFGFSDPAEVIGKTDFDLFHNEHATVAFKDELEIMRTGQAILGKVEKESASGEEDHWAMSSKYPIRDAGGEITGIFGISRDFTALKKYERELERRVAERTEDLQKANEGMQNRIAQLDFLTSTSFDLAQFIQVDELVPLILRSFGSRFSMHAASFCIQSGSRYSCVAATGPLDTEAGRAASEHALGVFTRTPPQRPYLIERWKTDEYISQFNWPEMDHLPCYLVIPLLAENRSLGVVQVFASAEAAERYKQEEKLLTTLAAQAAISLSNAFNYRELSEKSRLQGELEAARTIQRNFTPQHKPDIPHVNLKGVYYPAYEVGGDYLDYFQTAGGEWVLVIADVCGKGIPAALLMTVLRSSFRAEAHNEKSAKRLLCTVNDAMLINLDERSFVTALCLIISKDGTHMTYARAGHPKLVRVDSVSNRVDNVDVEGVALGLVNDSAKFDAMLDEVTIPLIPGERYLIYTDGLTEALNPARECYGYERLLELLSSAGKLTSPEAMINAIMKDVKAFTRGAQYHDDLTILGFQVTE
jgi:PAS domain S-box-containing protein